jgi:hypothetical protein
VVCLKAGLSGIDGSEDFNLIAAETAMGKPPFRASDGGRIDILRELEEIT